MAMEPFLFGPDQAPLYGVYEAAASGTSPGFGVLICYPFGHEYMRSYRAMRTLSRHLAQQGIPTLRFDYQGTGDSSGERFRLDTAMDNTLAAIQILQQRSGMDEIRIIGLRLGGPIALAAGRQNAAVTTLCLWDPVVSGAEYLHNMLKGDNNTVFHRNGETWIDGYPLEDREIDAIKAIDLTADADIDHLDKEMVIISTMEKQLGDTYCEKLRSTGVNARHEYHPATGRDRWDYSDRDGNLMLCSTTITRIREKIAS